MDWKDRARWRVTAQLKGTVLQSGWAKQVNGSTFVAPFNQSAAMSAGRLATVGTGGGCGSSSLTLLMLSSAIRAFMIDENVTGKGVPGSCRRVGSDSTACSSEAQAERMARLSSRFRVESVTTW